MTVNPRTYITFTIIYAGQEQQVQTYWDEYRDLRALIADKIFADEFGQCGGMGRCATCMVSISGSDSFVHIMNRNESATLSKTNALNNNIRLSCQLSVNDDLSNVVIHVIGNW